MACVAVPLPWSVMEDDLGGQPPIGFSLLFVLGFLLLSEVAVRRWGPVHLLFGMKPRKRRAAMQANAGRAPNR